VNLVYFTDRGCAESNHCYAAATVDVMDVERSCVAANHRFAGAIGDVDTANQSFAGGNVDVT
jgi:hypothetical protein